MAERSSLSLYESSGQAFTRRGRPGAARQSFARDMVNDFDGAIDDMANISTRLLIAHREAAEDLADVITQLGKSAIRSRMPPRGNTSRRSTGEPFEFSKGRLAAAWGKYTPEDMRGEIDVRDQIPIQAKHEAWSAANGVAGGGTQGRDAGEESFVEMAAVVDIKRVKGAVWSVEVGTFLPYAPLVNDGGTMLIHPYGNPNLEVEAHWEGVHFMEQALADTEALVEDIIGGTIQAALDGIPNRARRRRA